MFSVGLWVPIPLLESMRARAGHNCEIYSFSSLDHQDVMLLNAPEVLWVQNEQKGKPGEPYTVMTIGMVAFLDHPDCHF